MSSKFPRLNHIDSRVVSRYAINKQLLAGIKLSSDSYFPADYESPKSEWLSHVSYKAGWQSPAQVFVCFVLAFGCTTLANQWLMPKLFSRLGFSGFNITPLVLNNILFVLLAYATIALLFLPLFSELWPRVPLKKFNRSDWTRLVAVMAFSFEYFWALGYSLEIVIAAS
jgi:hypothetical protein